MKREMTIAEYCSAEWEKHDATVAKDSSDTFSEPVGGRGKWAARGGSIVDVTDEPAPIKELHSIITDEMPPLESQVDGKIYTSRSQYLRSLKEAGFEIVGKQRRDRMPEAQRKLREELKEITFRTLQEWKSKDKANEYRNMCRRMREEALD